MNRKMDYQVVTSGDLSMERAASALADRIGRLIDQGWEPTGGVALMPFLGVWVVQCDQRSDGDLRVDALSHSVIATGPDREAAVGAWNHRYQPVRNNSTR